jgi:hypothetical protein
LRASRELNAILVPSGDHRGMESGPAFSTSLRGAPLPSAAAM